MKKILFVISSLDAGGAEKSLVNLLNLFDYSKYSVDLLLFKNEGIFLKQVPHAVNIIDIPSTLKYSYKPLDIEGVKNYKNLICGINRYIGTAYARIYNAFTFKPVTQIRWNKFYKKTISHLSENYDIAVAYMHGEAMYYVADKVSATKKVCWIHNNYNEIKFDKELDKPYLLKYDNIATISEECVNILCDNFPEFVDKIRCIPNLTSASLIREMADIFVPTEYIKARNTGVENIFLSIGRLSRQKGFDYAIESSRLMKQQNLSFKWYIIGKGELYQDLLELIKKYELEEYLILLGVRENPYPYIKHCDILVQPSRYEGKSVVLDETKILAKPIVVSNYDTVKDQIINDKEGIVVELNSIDISEALTNLAHNPSRREQLSSYLLKNEYGNSTRINEYYNLFN